MSDPWTFEFTPKNGQPIDFIGMEHSAYLGPSIKTMVECLQNVRYHSEGNVWTHTKMCLQNLVDLQSYKDFDDEKKSIVFLATLLHDIGKPYTSKEGEGGELTFKGHSLKGARLARELMINWHSKGIIPISFNVREQVCNLTLLHMLPIYLFEKEDPLFNASASSYTLNNQMLATLSMADICGRKCLQSAIDIGKERVELFSLFCEESKCLTNPKPFITEKARFRYFFDRKGHPDYDYFEPVHGNVIVMCGLQASGKDHVIKEKYSHLPVVSLDQIRSDSDLDYGDDEPKVIFDAKEKCKAFMRDHKDFIFNATNIVKDIRRRWISLFRQYRYKITIHYKERPLEIMLKDNKNRENSIPEEVILEKVKKIDIPTLMECHDLVLDVE